jgi:hypothetical protein
MNVMWLEWMTFLNVINCYNDIDICKIDVEGCGYEVFDLDLEKKFKIS